MTPHDLTSLPAGAGDSQLRALWAECCHLRQELRQARARIRQLEHAVAILGSCNGSDDSAGWQWVPLDPAR